MSGNDLSAIKLFEAKIKKLNIDLELANKKLFKSNESFSNLIGKSLNGIVILSQQKIIIYVNDKAVRLFDKNIADLLGEKFAVDIISGSTSKIDLIQSNNNVILVEIHVVDTLWHNKPSFLVSFRDITEQEKASKNLKHLSSHDPLTGLFNRNHFERQMSKAIALAEKNQNYMALLYIDLDDFKIVNDTFGHSIGDELLVNVSDILKNNVRSCDTVARLGGDEFALILCSLKKPKIAELIAQKILIKLYGALYIENKEIFANASIGIAVYPDNGTTAEEIIKHADLAMYAAKKKGKNQYYIYSEKLKQHNEQNLNIINGLRVAIKNKELYLNYQPIIDIKATRCAGMEALLRWRHPELGLIPPDEFISCAEEMGMMVSIGRWVMKHALTGYNELGIKDQFITINLSANELDDKNIENLICNQIQSHTIEPKNVIFELTETSVMRHPEASIKKLNKSAQIGIKFAVDDYGTGYSSLSYLKLLPMSILKIDKSFIDDINKSYNDTIIVRSTIRLAHNLGLKVIAEGVETKEQLDFLKKNDCDYVQGYYFAKPMPLEELKSYVKKFNSTQ